MRTLCRGKAALRKVVNSEDERVSRVCPRSVDNGTQLEASGASACSGSSWKNFELSAARFEPTTPIATAKKKRSKYGRKCRRGVDIVVTDQRPNIA